LFQARTEELRSQAAEAGTADGADEDLGEGDVKKV